MGNQNNVTKKSRSQARQKNKKRGKEKMAKRKTKKEIALETFESEIIVKTQAELDAIPLDFKERIYIDGGTPYNRIIVRNKYYYCVEARENSFVVATDNSFVVARKNSYVVARDNSSVEAWDNSYVVARENSSVVAWHNSSVEAMNNSSVVAWHNSSVVATDNSSVVAWDNSYVVARDNSSVVARENSSVEARENSFVEARDNSSVVATDNSSVEAMNNSSVVARENSSVEANANAQIVDRSYGHKIKISGNARIVYMPKSIIEFCAFHGIKHTKTKAIFYKAVRKDGDMYFSDHDADFIYEVGKMKSEKCDADKSKECGQGIHIAPLNWALDYGGEWNNLAILEVETKLSDIVLPDDSDGKVRTSKIKVLREVPLEECGLYGKILAKRRG
jgi:hypothetical protein